MAECRCQLEWFPPQIDLPDSTLSAGWLEPREYRPRPALFLALASPRVRLPALLREPVRLESESGWPAACLPGPYPAPRTVTIIQ
jgi:hypothetical protein